MTNQASEDKLDEILDELQAQVIDGYTQPVNGWTTVKQEAKTAIQALIRTEKLKLLAEVRERVVGENEPEFNTPKPELGNMARNRLREAQTDLLTKLEAEL